MLSQFTPEYAFFALIFDFLTLYFYLLYIEFSFFYFFFQK